MTSSNPALLSADAPAWDLLVSSDQESSQIGTEIQSDNVDYESILKGIDKVFADMKVRIKESLVVAQGMQTFLKRYKEMTNHGKFSNAALGSALYKFGLVGVCEVPVVVIGNMVAEFLLVQRQLDEDVEKYQEAEQKHLLGDQRVPM